MTFVEEISAVQQQSLDILTLLLIYLEYPGLIFQAGRIGGVMYLFILNHLYLACVVSRKCKIEMEELPLVHVALAQQ